MTPKTYKDFKSAHAALIAALACRNYTRLPAYRHPTEGAHYLIKANAAGHRRAKELLKDVHGKVLSELKAAQLEFHKYLRSGQVWTCFFSPEIKAELGICVFDKVRIVVGSPAKGIELQEVNKDGSLGAYAPGSISLDQLACFYTLETKHK